MGAGGFVTLASHFPDRTIVTYDPRGCERSGKDVPTKPPTPEDHADDLHRVIQEVGGPVDLFASSGGAVNALALVAKHPEDVRTLVAHEPPLAVGPPRPRRGAGGGRRPSTTRTCAAASGAGMAHFIAVVEPPGRVLGRIRPAAGPDPAMFGMPTEDDGSRTDPLLGQAIIDPHALPARLRRPAQRLDADRDGRRGIEEGTMANRGADAVAERLGTEPWSSRVATAGSSAASTARPGEPEAFAAKLREVLGA